MRSTIGAMLLLALVVANMTATKPGAADLIEQITTQLVRSPLLRASFQQQKTMQVLSRPLITGGRVTSVTGRGVLWQAEEPHRVTVLMTDDQVVEWDEAGAPRTMDMAASPVFRALATVLLGALAGDTDELATFFELAPIPASQGWRLALLPKDPTLAGIVSVVEIAGDRFVEEAVITEAGGDETVIRFSDFRTQPTTLSAGERAYFER